MSLLSDAMTECVFLNKTIEPDGYGGFISAWNEGNKFKCAIRKDSSMQAQIAQQQGVTSVYSIITDKSLCLDYHDAIKRLSDGLILRVTSKGIDSSTPKSASLNMRIVTAEEWRIPNE